MKQPAGPRTAQGVKKQGTKDKLRCRSQGTVKSPIIRTNTLKILKTAKRDTVIENRGDKQMEERDCYGVMDEIVDKLQEVYKHCTKQYEVKEKDE